MSMAVGSAYDPSLLKSDNLCLGDLSKRCPPSLVLHSANHRRRNSWSLDASVTGTMYVTMHGPKLQFLYREIHHRFARSR